METAEEIMDLFTYDQTPLDDEFVWEPPAATGPTKFQLLVRDFASNAPNQQDEPNEFETPEWEEDFEFKASALRNMFQPAMPEDLYVELFGSLESKCHLLLGKKRKATAKSFYELDSYIQEHDHVFLYNQVFDGKGEDSTGRTIWYPKTYDALIGLKSFVVDIDEVNANNIRSVIDRIMSAPILPNYLNLTGNGLHLYFLFDAIHDVKHSAWLMASFNKTTATSERKVYVTIKQRMISWFHGTTAESDVSNHLTQPSRLAGSKTKNRNKRTILFKVSDTKYSIQHIAGLFGIDLPDEESIRQWKKKVNADKRREKKMQKAMTSEPASLLEFLNADDQELPPLPAPVVNNIDHAACITSGDRIITPNSKYRFDFEGHIRRFIEEVDWEVGSMEYQIREEQRKLWEKEKAKAASPEAQKRKIAQRRGLESQYNQFKQQMFREAKYGNRADLLDIFWNRGPAYQKDKDVVFRDLWQLVDHCNLLSRDKITDKQVWRIISGPHRDYTDKSIFNRIGVTITMTNKKAEGRKERRDAKEEKWRRILLICESELQDNPHLSDRQLAKILNAYGISVCHKTISTRPEIKELRARLRMQ